MAAAPPVARLHQAPWAVDNYTMPTDAQPEPADKPPATSRPKRDAQPEPADKRAPRRPKSRSRKDSDAMPVMLQTTLLLISSNVFMTFAWYAHLHTD